MACLISDDGTFAICCGGMIEVRRKPDRVRWCFNCRRHLPHDWIVMDYPEPSYYDPYGRYDCSGCHQEHVLFPGRVWADE